MIEEENHSEDSQHSPITPNNLNKAMAILFVLAIYIVIFLKILFLE